jgi:hypothetical protein
MSNDNNGNAKQQPSGPEESAAGNMTDAPKGGQLSQDDAQTKDLGPTQQGDSFQNTGRSQDALRHEQDAEHHKSVPGEQHGDSFQNIEQ